MTESRDTIDGSGFPLAFKVKDGESGTGEVYRVEARAMGAHQKEAIVTEGEGGSAWRMVSDEGPWLNGTDLAPFPLGFFNAGLQADLLGHIARLARARGVELERVEMELANRYAFEGSFFKGTGQGSAQPTDIKLRISSKADEATLRVLVHDAVQSSAALAACRVPLDNSFALYVNGRRRAVTSARPSAAPDAADPLKAHTAAPRPLSGAQTFAEIIRKIPLADAPSSPPIPAASRVEIGVLGRSRLRLADGATESETWLERPLGSHYAFVTHEREHGDQAPCGLMLVSAGIAFCYLTQLIRYIEYLKYNVRALRLVQFNPFPGTGAGPVDTHLFMHGDEPDEVMQRLLAMGANTCYLHATLAAALEPRISLELS